jgi:hypothetical protein
MPISSENRPNSHLNGFSANGMKLLCFELKTHPKIDYTMQKQTSFKKAIPNLRHKATANVWLPILQFRLQ